MNITLYPPSSSVAFGIFDMPVYWYGIIMAFSILLGIVVSYFLIRKRYSLYDAEVFLDLSPLMIIFAIVGARFFYVIGDWSYYSNNLRDILLINRGGLSIFGAIIFGLIFIFLYSKLKKISIVKYCDVVAAVLPLCQSVGRWGNFINQEAYGAPFNGFLRMYIDNNHRYPQFSDFEFYHPAFLYESLLDVLLFIILISLFTLNKNLKTGSVICSYLILYSIIRIVMENVRIDSVLNIYTIHIATILSVITIFIAGYTLYRLYKK